MTGVYLLTGLGASPSTALCAPPWVFRYDLTEKKVVQASEVPPSQLPASAIISTPWIWARNNKYTPSLLPNKTGKWMLFVGASQVNVVWKKIKEGIESGDLWQAKIATAPTAGSYAVMIYTKDHSDLPDVIRVLEYLEKVELKLPFSKPIYYKTDAQTQAGIYRGGKKRPWIYSSNTIRSPHPPAESPRKKLLPGQRSIIDCWSPMKNPKSSDTEDTA